MTNINLDIIKPQRSSNFELLRILSMFAIILGHFTNQSHALELLSGVNLYIVTFLGSAARIAVSVFLTIGIWFMLDSKFKASRVLNLYGQLISYTIPIFIFIKLMHIEISFFDSLRCLIPFYTFGLWFVSAYIILILLSPFLNKILEIDRNVIKKFLIVLFIFIPLMSTFWIKMDTKLCVLAYFLYAYLYIGYFKKYMYNTFNFNKYLLLGIGFLLYIAIVSMKFIFLQNNYTGAFYLFINNCIIDYKAIPNLLIALPIFYFFLKTDIGSNKVINFISKSVLATYIIHQTPGFINYLWHNIYNCDYWLTTQHPILYIIFVATTLYIICIPIDYIRRKIIEPILTNSLVYKFIEEKINHFYSDIQSIYRG